MRTHRRTGGACDRASGLNPPRGPESRPAGSCAASQCVACMWLQVTASAATRRRNMAAKKNDGNVTKRGLVEDESLTVRIRPASTQPPRRAPPQQLLSQPPPELAWLVGAAVGPVAAHTPRCRVLAAA